MSYEDFLTQTCTIQGKSDTQDGYEQVTSWVDEKTGVPCRKDSSNSPDISDGTIRINSEDDLFFLKAGEPVDRSKRLVFDGGSYDVLKVNEVYARNSVHHLEVVARLTDLQ